MYKVLIMLVFLLAGCAGSVPLPPVLIPDGTCYGDVDGDGVVAENEIGATAQLVLGLVNGETVVTKDGTSYARAAVVRASDANGDGVISGDEFAFGMDNSMKGQCIHVFTEAVDA